jgi:vacuolar-type H+-ATPase subunit F/Vma7
MARVAAIGELTRIQGFALAGAVVLVASNPEAVRAAWSSLDQEVAVVVLTPAAAAAIGDEPCVRRWPLTVVMPP